MSMTDDIVANGLSPQELAEKEYPYPTFPETSAVIVGMKPETDLQRAAFIRGLEWKGEDWVSVETELPQVVDKKMKPVLVKHLKYKDKVYHTVAFYFPDRFKTIEWEDWDDYDEKNFPYTESDEKAGCVWLRAGWYEDIDCQTCDWHWSQPLKVTHWMNIPSLPQPHKIN